MSVTIVRNNAAAAIAAALKGVAAGNLATAEVVANAARDAIATGSKTGRIYKGHQASAPGEAPAILHGDLIEGIRAEQDGTDAATLSTDEKSQMLEYGRADGKMLPRPFMDPAAEEARDDHARLVADALRAALR